ncbi:Ribonuclease H [Quillaja saponaria]|uniref:Ribonuclease H n=1 Tax=Quillaja saponaria TaxID=32244 RepID=A0AAD7LNW5_QUISA|nr:Ribonuclease H [Quillaja saponaria]
MSGEWFLASRFGQFGDGIISGCLKLVLSSGGIWLLQFCKVRQFEQASSMEQQVGGWPLSNCQEVLVGWVFLRRDWVKLNTDGASKRGVLAGAGGVFGDSSGV